LVSGPNPGPHAVSLSPRAGLFRFEGSPMSETSPEWWLAKTDAEIRAAIADRQLLPRASVAAIADLYVAAANVAFDRMGAHVARELFGRRKKSAVDRAVADAKEELAEYLDEVSGALGAGQDEETVALTKEGEAYVARFAGTEAA